MVRFLSHNWIIKKQYIRCCLISPLRYLHSFSLFFFFSFEWFHYPEFTDPFLCLICSAVEPCIEFIKYVIVFFKSMISIWQFLIFSLFSWNSHCVQFITHPWWAPFFMMLILCSLSGKSFIPISLSLVAGVILYFCLDHIPLFTFLDSLCWFAVH